MAILLESFAFQKVNTYRVLKGLKCRSDFTADMINDDCEHRCAHLWQSVTLPLRWLPRSMKSKTIIEVITDVFSMSYFQSILRFWQSKLCIIIQVQLIHYNNWLKITVNAPNALQFCNIFWEGSCPQIPQLYKPFDFILSSP